jgi:hypothetical protein
MMRVCLTPSNILKYPKCGGHAWCFLNWALGLQAAGCKVIWALPFLRDWWSPDETVEQVRYFLGLCERIGLNSPIALILDDHDRAHLRSVEGELAVLTIPLEAAAEESDLLLNFEYTLAPQIVARFKRTALVDIDPGLLQVWMAQGLVRPARHDTYFTIGETVGQPDALFSDCGLEWRYTPPPVCMSAWPPTNVPDTGSYTTVSGWWGEWLEHNRQLFENSKRIAFLEYLELPCQTPVHLELVLCLGHNDLAACKSLEEKGWTVKLGWGISADEYRSYLLRSRGEFACAKPSCMRLQNAWVSDRTVCYLASGKPAIVQHTGPSRFLPDSRGMFRFRTPAEALHAFQLAEADYETHSREARALAEEYFAADKVVQRVLEQATT